MSTNDYSPSANGTPVPVTLQAPGRDEYMGNDLAQTARKLNQVVNDAHEVLVSASTVFPFTLFPDTVTVDRTKLTITRRTFFKVAEVMSIRIEDILNVTANVGPVFGSLKISTRFFSTEKPDEVHYFWRKDALRIKRIMQGYIIASQKKIDCSALTASQLTAILDELGQGEPQEAI